MNGIELGCIQFVKRSKARLVSNVVFFIACGGSFPRTDKSPPNGYSHRRRHWSHNSKVSGSSEHGSCSRLKIITLNDT